MWAVGHVQQQFTVDCFLESLASLCVYGPDHTLASGSEQGEVVSSHFSKEEAEKHRGCITRGPENRNRSQIQFSPCHSKCNASLHSTFISPDPGPQYQSCYSESRHWGWENVRFCTSLQLLSREEGRESGCENQVGSAGPGQGEWGTPGAGAVCNPGCF